MEKVLNKFYYWEEKIGRHNVILIIFIFLVTIITGLYTTFSLYTSMDNYEIVNGIPTYKFILNGDDELSTLVSVPANTNRGVEITVSNKDKTKLKYGIYYTSSSDLTKVNIGYTKDSSYEGKGIIDGESDYIVSVSINNSSDVTVNVNFGLLFGLESGGDLSLSSGQTWLEAARPVFLNQAKVGSYVAYTGNNGCPEGHCDGTNANYVEGSSNGYCFISSYKYNSNGWRLAYINSKNKPVIVSAGSPECSDRELIEGNTTYIKNANTLAMKYCNSELVDGNCSCLDSDSDGYCDCTDSDSDGLCDEIENNEVNAWAIGDIDFYNITRTKNGYGKRLTNESSSLGDNGGSLGSTLYCYGSSLEECGLGNDLIDNGGFYWFASRDSSSSRLGVTWRPNSRYVYSISNSDASGLRPVISLSSSVIITGGSGTEDDPYTIENMKDVSHPKLSAMEPGSYVNYVGNNGCTGNSCSGSNASCHTSTDTSTGTTYGNPNFNGWRIVYSKDNNAYLISAGAPDCMCTNSDFTGSNTSCSSKLEGTGNESNVSYHINNINSSSLKYCNVGFVDGGYCDISSTRNIDGTDFKIITGSDLSTDSCYGISSDISCGYENTLIDNGGFYWYTTRYSLDSYRLFAWNPANRYIDRSHTNLVLGVRPIIRIDSSVYVTGGNGTKDNPYIIENPNTIKDLSGNMNNGAVNGATWNKVDGTLSTDGVNDYVNMGLKNYDFGNSITLVTRFKLNSLPPSETDYYIFGNWESGGFGLVFGNRTARSGYYVTYGTYTTGAGDYVYPTGVFNSVVADNWYTFIGVYDGSAVYLYRDGNLVARLSSSGNIKTSNTFIALGGNPYNNSVVDGFSDVTFDYALIYDRALTATEIANNFSSGEISRNQVDTTDLVAYYDFKE